MRTTLAIIFSGAFMALSAAASPAFGLEGFHVSGRDLLDVNGNRFILRGINHPHAWYPSRTASLADIKKIGRANAVRIVLSGGRWPANGAAEVAGLINSCRAAKLVCVLENHDPTGYGEQGGATTLAQAADYWKSIQGALAGQEAYVMLNIGNEPFGNNNAADWVEATKGAVAALRKAGFRHTLMVDAPNWGQDWQSVMRNHAAEVFAGDSLKNMIFSVHMYGWFNTPDRVQSYVAAFVAAGLPLAIGEFGDRHSDGDPDEDAILATAESQGIGYLGWSWSGNGGGVEYLDMVTGFDATQLTNWGKRIVQGANGLAATAKECSCFGTSEVRGRATVAAGFSAIGDGSAIRLQWNFAREFSATVFDSRGRVLRFLEGHDGEAVWGNREGRPGIFLVRLEAQGHRELRRMAWY